MRNQMRIDSLSIQTIIEWAKTQTQNPVTLYIEPKRIWITFTVRETISQKEIYSLAVHRNQLEGRQFREREAKS